MQEIKTVIHFKLGLLKQLHALNILQTHSRSFEKYTCFSLIHIAATHIRFETI